MATSATSPALARTCPRARPHTVTNTGGRHSATRVGIDAPMRAMPWNHAST
jgi:hypothetical protein